MARHWTPCGLQVAQCLFGAVVPQPGYGEKLLAPWRYLTTAQTERQQDVPIDNPVEEPSLERIENAEFVLNRAPFRQSTVLIAGANFGSSSSREQAVWALRQFGLRCVIAPSFGTVFRHHLSQQLPSQWRTAGCAAGRAGADLGADGREWATGPHRRLVRMRDLSSAAIWLFHAGNYLDRLASRFAGPREGRVVAMDEGIALLAADLAASHKLHALDALIYATALLHDAELVTCDAHFKGLPQVGYFAKPR